MASLGKVVSTAITGGDAPYVQGVERVREVVEAAHTASTAADERVQALEAKVDQLLAILAAQAQKAPVVEPEVELTPGEKAARTRAENKAKAEAEAAEGGE